MSTWILQYDVAMRRGKFMMALQVLFQARALDATSSELFSRIVDFAHRTQQTSASLPAVVQQVVDSELPELLQNCDSVTAFVAATAASLNGTLSSLWTRIAVLKAMGDATVIDGLEGRDVTVESCREAALGALKELGATDAAAAWKMVVQERFPLMKLLE